MQNNFPACLSFTLSREGGFVNDPHDPGGATMRGVTLAVFRAWKQDSQATIDQLRHITDADLSGIYRKWYWDIINGDALPAGVDLSVFDMFVNAGYVGARLLQAAVGVTTDGVIGPKTLAATNMLEPADLINDLAERHEAYYRSLKNFKYYGKGWLNRTNARQNAALAMVRKKLKADLPKVQTYTMGDFYLQMDALTNYTFAIYRDMPLVTKFQPTAHKPTSTYMAELERIG